MHVWPCRIRQRPAGARGRNRPSAPVEDFGIDGSEEQKQFFFARVLDGDRFGNAFTGVGTKTMLDLKTRLARDGQQSVLNGRKNYSTGAIYSHWVPTVAFRFAETAGRAMVMQ